MNMSYVSRAGLTISISNFFLILTNLRFNELTVFVYELSAHFFVPLSRGCWEKNGDGCDWVPMILFITWYIEEPQVSAFMSCYSVDNL